MHWTDCDRHGLVNTAGCLWEASQTDKKRKDGGLPHSAMPTK